MQALRIIGLALLSCWVGLSALAEEAIERFDVDITVEKDGDIIVTETIAVTVEGREIRRGIFRELPAFYADPDGPGNLPFQYKVLSVRKDGAREPYERERNGNAVLIRIGDPDRYLDYREHVYEIRYRVKNQIRYQDAFDELYWNVTGTYWAFPIRAATARIRFPGAANPIEYNAYTGGFGSSESNASYRREDGAHVFTTTDRLVFARV